MAKAKILIVEDDGIVALDIKERVENLGYSVLAILSYGENTAILNISQRIKPIASLQLVQCLPLQ